jgi:anti-sigma factor RsiW
MLLERLSAYLDGDLGAADCRRIDRHARACPRCTKLLAGLRRTIAICRTAGARPLPPAVRRAARARVRALLRDRPPRRSRR